MEIGRPVVILVRNARGKDDTAETQVAEVKAYVVGTKTIIITVSHKVDME